ncbi:MAG: fatty acid desaturase [Deltaproteobacteria bacterium]|nr:fatty acid desaturase [Deltaproteobacteria bacterium]
MVTAHINGKPIQVERRETLLQAALRQGINFPHSCRVGGCATCKCRLAQGKVRELTETGYLLSGREIEEGYILACQSVPRSDVRIEVDLGPQAARSIVTGRVTGQEKLTHDITRLSVLLDEPMPYRAGQFANLSLESLQGVARSYSFATPPREDRRVSFFVRKAPGGRLSGRINDHDVVGDRVTLQGPSGDFWLRPGDAPLLLIAGGSGLAPILAMLREAAAAGESRPTTLLFGAREQKDLYALGEIEEVARSWKGPFRFVPVLSAAEDDAEWTGARGLVTEHIAEHLQPGAHGYLCGPPAMVDSAVARLREHGVAREHILFDRFSTQHDVAVGAHEPKPSAWNALHYAKFFGFHAVGLFAIAALLAGGRLTTAGLLTVLTLYVAGDAICGDDTSTPKFRFPGILTAQLWLALPLLSLTVFSAVWSVCEGDPLGFGAWLSGWTGYDLIAAREATGPGGHVSAWILTGLMIGMVGTIPAHELTHRTWDPISMSIGRWLLAFSFDTTFAIEHVYGHHRYVSTTQDPATAPRGRNVYVHILASTLKGNVSAWHIEAERLRKKHLGPWRNAVIRGHLMSVALAAGAWAMGGWRATLFFTACAIWGKSLLEIVNYMEHYGIVRDPATPVQPRHSWNTNRRISSWTMFNLTRHSHHHAQGEVPYQDLKPLPNAPMMINGYLTTIMVAMIPALWHRWMTPKVLAWDRDFAVDGERLLAAAANARSGIAALEESARRAGM